MPALRTDFGINRTRGRRNGIFWAALHARGRLGRANVYIVFGAALRAFQGYLLHGNLRRSIDPTM